LAAITCLAPPWSQPRPADARRRVLRALPRAARARWVTRSLPWREPLPRHAAFGPITWLLRRQVRGTWPVTCIAAVAGVDREGTERQISILRVAVAGRVTSVRIGNVGSTALRAPAWAGPGKWAALTIHPYLLNTACSAHAVASRPA
jgi:hypothetical protein